MCALLSSRLRLISLETPPASPTRLNVYRRKTRTFLRLGFGADAAIESVFESGGFEVTGGLGEYWEVGVPGEVGVCWEMGALGNSDRSAETLPSGEICLSGEAGVSSDILAHAAVVPGASGIAFSVCKASVEGISLRQLEVAEWASSAKGVDVQE